jgi:hypothetical protein
MECGALSDVDAIVRYVVVLLRDATLIAYYAEVILGDMCHRHSGIDAGNTDHIAAVYALERVH